MNRTLTARSPLAAAAAVLSALGLLIALTGPGLTPAAADQFTPLEDPPSITIDADDIVVGDTSDGGFSGDEWDVTDIGADAFSAFSTFVPAASGASPVYNVFATITTNGQLDNVELIRFCLYDSGDSTAFPDDAAVDSACGIDDAQDSASDVGSTPTPTNSDNEPENRLVMEWRSDAYHDEILGEGNEDGDSDPEVIVVGSNNYADVDTAYNVTYGDNATGSALVRFSFTVSDAMQVSDAWKIRMAAQSQATISTPQQTQSAVDTSGGTSYEVSYFARMVTGRTATDYGIVTPGVTVVKSNDVGSGTTDAITSGTYTANNLSSLTIGADAFTYDNPVGGDVESTIPLDDKGDVGPGVNSSRRSALDTPTDEEVIDNVTSGKVSLDCAYIPDPTLTSNLPSDDTELDAFVQVGETARVLATDLAATDESAVTLDKHSCMLSYPGGGTVANVEHSNTVTLALIEDADDSDQVGD